MIQIVHYLREHLETASCQGSRESLVLLSGDSEETTAGAESQAHLLRLFMQVGHGDARRQDGVVWVLSGEISSRLRRQGVELGSLDAGVDALDAFQRDQCCAQEEVLASSAVEGERRFRKETGTRVAAEEIAIRERRGNSGGAHQGRQTAC